jgi:hypothetical protein
MTLYHFMKIDFQVIQQPTEGKVKKKEKIDIFLKLYSHGLGSGSECFVASNPLNSTRRILWGT